jgi:hypothetical protein
MEQEPFFKAGPRRKGPRDPQGARLFAALLVAALVLAVTISMCSRVPI